MDTGGRCTGATQCSNEPLGVSAVERHRAEDIAVALVEDHEVRVEQRRGSGHEVVQDALRLGGCGGQRAQDAGRRALALLRGGVERPDRTQLSLKLLDRDGIVGGCHDTLVSVAMPGSALPGSSGLSRVAGSASSPAFVGERTAHEPASL